jgi:hypothetical protein
LGEEAGLGMERGRREGLDVVLGEDA